LVRRRPRGTAIFDHFLCDAEVIQITGKSDRLHHAGSSAPAPDSKPANLPAGSQKQSPPGKRSGKPAELQSTIAK
jgi:hypothetical protein